ncbi:MAG: hypothetical protein K2Q21_08085 [Chitinophagaceae bacterium]|nr:hypothetical protein [Chitinophagaceae bacterium]
MGIQKSFFILVLFFQMLNGSAQSIQLPVGTKFYVTTFTTNLAEITMMDQHMQLHNDGSLKASFDVKAVTNTGYTLQITPLHLNTKMSMNGQEQNFDSDSSANLNNPDLAKLIGYLNKPQTIVVENNKTVSAPNLDGLNPTGNRIEDPSKYFLSIHSSDIKNGFHWTDSIINDASKIYHQYTILRATETEVELNVNTDYESQIKTKQGAVEMIQNLKGFSTGRRIYSKANGLLKEENLTMDISGNTEYKELSSPMTMKLTFKTIVN